MARWLVAAGRGRSSTGTGPDRATRPPDHRHGAHLPYDNLMNWVFAVDRDCQGERHSVGIADDIAEFAKTPSRVTTSRWVGDSSSGHAVTAQCDMIPIQQCVRLSGLPVSSARSVSQPDAACLHPAALRLASSAALSVACAVAVATWSPRAASGSGVNRSIIRHHRTSLKEARRSRQFRCLWRHARHQRTSRKVRRRDRRRAAHQLSWSLWRWDVVPTRLGCAYRLASPSLRAGLFCPTTRPVWLQAPHTATLTPRARRHLCSSLAQASQRTVFLSR